MSPVFTQLLDIPFSPHMKSLFPASHFLSLHFQILKNNHICLLFPGICRNGTGYFPGQFHIQPLCVCPAVMSLSGSMLSLKSADSAKHPVKPVFITGEAYKPSSQDSSVCLHDCTDRIRIDSQIHTADGLSFYSRFRQVFLFCIRKPQKIFVMPFLQSGRGRFFPCPVLSKVFHIRV